ncbi:conjugal transfer protein TrbI [Erythrobacter sp. SCSIO 43205]|nr:conjugal transfer protein TrbI [Erythrobacter sp. SCSIO 43205]
MWAFGAVLIIGGIVLYNALGASEDEAQVPSVLATNESPPTTRIQSPPPLSLPERFREPLPPPAERAPVLIRTAAPPIIRSPAPSRQLPPPLPVFEPAPQPPRADPGPQVVFQAQAQAPISPSARGAEAEGVERVSADRLRNPSFTIPQGTVIPAVLETALDSTRAGGVRALVQRDVMSFDGTRVLIQRGSRLYGEYEANLQSGQNRALVQWTRLIRPDGVTIALNSPSSDPLGRAGIRGKVDSKFLQRFGGAILQSVLDIGVGLAVNEASDGVLVALPGSTQNVQIAQPESIRPTLKVRHGTSVSVFVARDLDFSSVDR